MAQSTRASQNHLQELGTLVDSVVTLIQGFEEAMKDVVDSNSASGPSADKWSIATSAEDRSKALDCLALARDSASLVKAHSTKISLLIITEPFTPSAILTVLRELIQGPIPALASAVQQCHADLYTKVVRRDLAWRCGRILRELRELVQKIPKDGSVLPQDKRTGMSVAKGEKGSIVTTGVLWSVCDDVISFSNLGVAGHLVHRAEHLRDTIKDVMEELKEWSEEQGDDDGEEDGNEHNDDETTNEEAVDSLANGMNNVNITTQDMLDDFMNSQATIPPGDPEKIRERLDSTLRRLRLIVLLYQALVKRRLKTLPKLPRPSESDAIIVSRLDEVMPLLRKLSDLVNSLALAFYDLDSDEINRLMDQCFFDAFAVSELLAKPWTEKEDEFTKWVSKFQVEIKKI